MKISESSQNLWDPKKILKILLKSKNSRNSPNKSLNFSTNILKMVRESNTSFESSTTLQNLKTTFQDLKNLWNSQKTYEIFENVRDWIKIPKSYTLFLESFGLRVKGNQSIYKPLKKTCKENGPWHVPSHIWVIDLRLQKILVSDRLEFEPLSMEIPSLTFCTSDLGFRRTINSFWESPLPVIANRFGLRCQAKASKKSSCCV